MSILFHNKKLVFVSNGSCVNSEKGRITSNTKSNRVSVYWSDEQGNLM